MSIDRIHDNLSAEARAAQTQGTGRGQSVDQAKKIDAQGTTGDDADVSRLSRLMATSAQALDQDMAVRPEKVEAFKSIAGSDLQLTDKHIDTILSRMAGN